MDERLDEPRPPGSMKQRAYWIQAIIALALAGIWIALGCTLPAILAGTLWRRFGLPPDAELHHLAVVGMQSAAVLALLLFTGRRSLLRWRRPSRPAVLFAYVPLLIVNVTRGPFTEQGASYILVALATALLIGFWEEFLFRGLIQTRLSVLGPRLAILIATVFFCIVHLNQGLWQVCLVTFPIGLALGVARRPLGMWPLVLIHATIDFVHDLFVRTSPDYVLILRVTMAYTLLVGVIGLIKSGRDPEERQGAALTGGADLRG